MHRNRSLNETHKSPFPPSRRVCQRWSGCLRLRRCLCTSAFRKRRAYFSEGQPQGHQVSPQNDNVLFAQSRNVRLTAPSLGDARRTTTDDTSRTGPPGGPEEGEEEA